MRAMRLQPLETKTRAFMLPSFRLDASAKKHGVSATPAAPCFTPDAPDLLIREARLRDLTILPAFQNDKLSMIAESFVFGLGAQ